MLPKWLTNNLQKQSFVVTVNSFGYPPSPWLGLHNKPYNTNQRSLPFPPVCFMPSYSGQAPYASVVPLLALVPGRWGSSQSGTAFLQSRRKSFSSLFSSGVRAWWSKSKARPSRVLLYSIFLCDWLISICRALSRETALNGIYCSCFSVGCFYDLSFLSSD